MENSVYLANEKIHSLWLVDIFDITMSQLPVQTPTFVCKENSDLEPR